jgi:hypothetical protein
MRKSIILNICLYVALTIALVWLLFVEANPAKDKLYADFGRWLAQNLLAKPEFEAHVEERRLALQGFQAATDDVEAALCAGDVDLAQAVEQILGIWRQQFPDPVGELAQLEPGDTEQERLARSIVRRIEQNERLRDNQELRNRLQTQLADLLKKAPKTPQRGPIISMA